jgi:AAA15 family ATPase/GTPase
MVADKERQHGERVPRLPKYHLRVLPVTALFGGNASGKTNFFLAFSFAKRLVVQGTSPGDSIAVEPYELSPESLQNPTSFQFELLCGNDIYDFSFTVTDQAVLEERLARVLGKTEHELYHRHDGKCDFPYAKNKDKLRYDNAFSETRDNQLFLTSSVSHQLDYGRPVYDWFKDTLKLIAPDSRFGDFEYFYDVNHPLYIEMIALLKGLDIAASDIVIDEIPLKNLPYPENFIKKITENIKDNETVRFFPGPTKERYFVTKRDGELIAKRLTTMHETDSGELVRFSLSRESDGTLRMIDLLPVFVDLMVSSSKYVFLVDDLDNSLHPELTRSLIEQYLCLCDKETRTQLLFTTHNAYLMDQRLLRRDEIWLVDRGFPMASTLYSLNTFVNLRYDKILNQDYLNARFGGVPRILISNPQTLYQ